MLDLEFAALSDPGKVREHNEDCVGHVAPDTEDSRKRGWLFALADGVGGHDRGEVASRAAIDSLSSGFSSSRHDDVPFSLLQRLVESANLNIYETGMKARPGGSSMCTTLVACLLRFDRATIAHVGDSRCYLVRGGHARVLTHDHTVVGEQVRMGLMSADEAAASARRHLLSRSLGANMFVNVDLDEQQILPGDVLVLSSDGMHASLSLREIAGIVGRNFPVEDAAHELVSMAKEKDGSDNISVQVIRIKSVERVGMYRGRPYKLR